MERINDVYARGNSFQSAVNNISESKKSVKGEKIDEMKLIMGAGNENKCNSIKLPPPVNCLTTDELKYSIKEAMFTLGNKSPAILGILVMMYEAFNKNNQALADINAKMTVINEMLMVGVAEEIKSKGRWDLFASGVNTLINVGVGIAGSKMTHKAAEMHTAANKMDATRSALPAKKDITADPAETTDATKNIHSGQTDTNSEPAIDNHKKISSTDEETQLKESTNVNDESSQLKESINVTVDTADGAELRAEATKLTANGQLLTTISNIGVIGQLVSLGGKSEEARQVVDQNYAQVALSLFQTGATDSDSNKKYVEAMLQSILNIIENIVQARDTAAQNC
ncbi:TPA: hypothetical protein OB786_000287 [Escherichia fergusonii]|uniref:hypothetical protein n=1 Tax=Escherichia fergusonii TaxID=564 RepID=UPI001765DD43|nr:hypothetical protein [Escherichia fergusonii]HAI1303479.1 hypothetical protein [Escherichia fergusonii]HCO8232341.1 hypothetical protein [Escherichia fergusonii]